MYLAVNYIHPTPHRGRCRVRIYEYTTELPVILCTELQDNPGMSITNAVEQIAAEVIEGHPEVIDPFSIAAIPGVSYTKPFLWIEHYEDGARGTPKDPATFDLVEFESYEAQKTLRASEWVKEIGRPSWKPLTREMVEVLIGEELR